MKKYLWIKCVGYFIAFYLAFFILSYVFSKHDKSLYERILLPIFCGIGPVIGYAYRSKQKEKNKPYADKVKENKDKEN